MLGEQWLIRDEIRRYGRWDIAGNTTGDYITMQVSKAHHFCRTRRPLPPPPPTFEHDGKVWNSHVPGDPRPVDKSTVVQVFTSRKGASSRARAEYFGWRTQELDKAHWGVIIGYRIPDAEPVNDTAKLRERIAELEENEKAMKESLMSQDRVHRQDSEMLEKRLYETERQLSTALTPRPIAEAGPVKEGFERIFFSFAKQGRMGLGGAKWMFTTHFIDIRLPVPNPRAEYERAVAEAGGHYEAWLKAKGGAE
jgi:hypothetical protein